MKRKALVFLYEGISLFEITQLTAFLTSYQTVELEWILDTVSSEKKLIRSEDNFNLLPDYTFGEIDYTEYELIILSGIIEFRKVINDERFIKALGELKTISSDRPLIAAISAAPILMAKAGLLDSCQFTCGLFEEDIDAHSFIKQENIVRKPIVYDEKNNILTAIGFASRNFAIETARLLGYNLSDDAFIGADKDRIYTPEELTFFRN